MTTESRLDENGQITNLTGHSIFAADGTPLDELVREHDDREHAEDVVIDCPKCSAEWDVITARPPRSEAEKIAEFASFERALAARRAEANTIALPAPMPLRTVLTGDYRAKCVHVWQDDSTGLFGVTTYERDSGSPTGSFLATEAGYPDVMTAVHEADVFWRNVESQRHGWSL